MSGYAVVPLVSWGDGWEGTERPSIEVSERKVLEGQQEDKTDPPLLGSVTEDELGQY